MVNLDIQLKSNPLTQIEKNEAVRHFKQAVSEGKHWYIALLESIQLWTEAKESYNGRIYRYLIAGEAFDWLLLAERLCDTVDGLLPEDEKLALLFCGKAPIELTADRFKTLIGTGKYSQYLNYFYGVTVEEALILAVQGEVCKERWASIGNNKGNIINEVYQRIYGATKDALLKSFRQEKDYPSLGFTNLTELKEFAYWLFKYRLAHCDKARVASDTKKALEWLGNYGLSGKPRR